MTLIISPFVLANSIPVVMTCITAIFRSGCSPRDCISSPAICIPQHDDRRVVIKFVDSNGTPFDITGATEITVIISKAVNTAPSITKTLTGEGLVRANPTTVIFLLSSAETGGLSPGRNYYECRIQNLTGKKTTVLSGVLEVQDTLIGD